MKANTRQDYLQRIDRVVARLQAAVVHGGELPELGQLAAAAHLSPFHFHRVYRALAGETVGQTVARLRMLRALQRLAEPDGRVTEAALAVGYDTPQAFARAFRQVFDTTPSEMREQRERLRAEMERLRLPPSTAAGPEPSLQVEVVSVQPFRLVAMRYHGDPADLDQAYARLFQWAAGRGLLERMSGIYGVPYDDPRDTPAEQCAFDCALAFDGATVPVDGAMQAMELGGGLWARSRHVGSYDELADEIDHLIAGWLPGSGYVLRDGQPFRHFLDDPEDVPEAIQRADTYLPVAPA
ncbi:GyrI-like domain-containing protein [Dyella sp. C9]|uniref:AraC family transcriptional regulator n=1 Tax=Dyella sp. C9 TaxID=2202154 RepID=UPI000DEEBB9D|nr:GyrI-like domain-containing protein [Dyella sp. C9]